ncbi:CDP-diacylglycerol--serine O-phosphatidyltransferase [Fodinisporobacter ferrooxydans]|uniref:CDP-diacylglycerol--serine O-phosphatidyltransferase n=1 Tax=Fodinisporobacter ferrooxydans TaxID=2901836 RepID=A0ABY4CN82_9BACL|nr:CDP-diacylglycerol--serine O-phosphatidyltransferase [Alicyclobacillaceae bacterium MYW30-H2]
MWLKLLPNVFTLGNLFLGMIAILLASQGEYGGAALLIIVGMVLDGVDGRIARMFHVQSEFGKELDSLSDIVTFGIAPAVLMYAVVLHQFGWIGIVLSCIFPGCGALRLARFNTQSKTTNYFIGLPITAAGGVLATLALYMPLLPKAHMILPIAMMFLAYLMVSKVKYPNFKKLGIPKRVLFIAPLIVGIVVVVFYFHRDVLNRLIFLPLAVYALYGVQRKLRKVHKRDISDEVYDTIAK